MIAGKEVVQQGYGMAIFSVIDYRNPATDQLLVACPYICWRKCHDCNFIGLYRDGIIPACLCHSCKSGDTRLMRKETALLRRTTDAKGVTGD